MWTYTCSLRLASAASAALAVPLLPDISAARKRHSPSRSRHKWFIASQLSQCEVKKVKLADLVHHQADGLKLADVYTKGKKIGEGGFGKVYLAKHHVLLDEVAVKTMERAPEKDKELFHEIDALLKLDHPHIVGLLAYFKEPHLVHLVFELCSGPELFDQVVSEIEDKGKMPEWEIAKVMRHVLKAVSGCHTNFMGHYDIKPENFMFVGKEMDNLKMIDLGASGGFNVIKNRKLRMTGTPEYMAPEFHEGIYAPSGDVFSCGIMLFVMLTGELLFPEMKDMKALSQLKKDRKWMQQRLTRAQAKHNFSDDAMDLLKNTLRADRHLRIALEDALEHPFLSKAASHESYRQGMKALYTQHQMDSLVHFKRFSEYPLIKRTARLVLAHTLPRTVTNTPRLAFRSMDRIGCGEMSAEAFDSWFQKHGVPVPDDFDEIFAAVNIGGDGYINKSEYLAAGLSDAIVKDPKYCKVVFDILDADKDQIISAEDLHDVFRSYPTREWRLALEEVCPDRAPLTWDRFSSLMELPCES